MLNHSDSYFWAYFTKNINNTVGKCKICGNLYTLKAYTNIKFHIKKEHERIMKEHENSVHWKKKWPFSIIRNHETKCDICGQKYDIYYYVSNAMRLHLQNAHNINIKNQNWMSHYKYTISNETMECKHCKIIFQNDVKHKYFNAMKHLINAHQIAGISLEFRSTGNAEDVAVSSGCQQPTYSWNHYASSSLGFSTNATDTLTTSHNNFLYLDRNAENVTVSSGCQQPTYGWNHYASSSLGFSTNATDTLTTSHNNFLYLNRNSENVAVLSRCQQPTYGWNHYASSSSLSSSTNAIHTSTTSHQESIHDCYQFNKSYLENTELGSSPLDFDYEDLCAIEDRLKENE